MNEKIFDSIDNWCLTLYNRGVFEECMTYAAGTDMPPLNFLERFTQLLDGYTMYINARIKEKLNNE